MTAGEGQVYSYYPLPYGSVRERIGFRPGDFLSANILLKDGFSDKFRF